MNPLYSKNNKYFDFYIKASSEYNDNIFSLSGSQESTYYENNPEDNTSGRFEDMNSLSDNIFSPEFGMGYKINNPFGGRLELSSQVIFNYFVENENKSYPEFGLNIKQTVSEYTEIRLETSYIYGFFNKNYLSDITDLAGPNVGRDERIYSAGIYDEFEVTADYRYSFDLKGKDMFFTELRLKPYLGFNFRKYNSDFENRDRDVLFSGLSIDLEMLKVIELSAGYEYELISSPGNEELILFDEIEYGSDVNGDFSIRANAPLFTEIDRSADRHKFEIGTKIGLFKDLELDMGYGYTQTIYSSDNELDLSHYEQTENSWQTEASLKYKFSKFLNCEIGYQYENEFDADDGNIITRSLTGKLRYDF